jgi:hypothetical protein
MKTGAFDAPLRFVRRIAAMKLARPPRHRNSFDELPSHPPTHQLMRCESNPCDKQPITIPRVLIHVGRSENCDIDPGDLDLLEARGGETEIRFRSSTPLVDVRPTANRALQPKSRGSWTPMTPPYRKKVKKVSPSTVRHRSINR